MIYTVTFNPSLDYIVSVDNFTCGIVNRTTDEIIFPGGKGINVSMVLKNLGFENTALGFLAGFTGNRIQELLEEKGVRTDFISVEKGISRINVKLRSREETEINGQGPAIAEMDIKKLYEKLDTLSDGDILVLAGIMQKIHQLHQCFLSLVLTCYIGKAFASLRFHIDLSIALAEAHSVTAHTLAHEVHK